MLNGLKLRNPINALNDTVSHWFKDYLVDLSRKNYFTYMRLLKINVQVLIQG